MAKAKDEETKTVGMEPVEMPEAVPFQVSEPESDLPEPVFVAAKFYGIDRQFILAWKVYPEREEVVLLTHGGKKVTWKPGVKVEPLTMIEVTGAAPPKKSVLLK
jgi:hypothetical protein